MKKYGFTALPYTTQHCTIEAPDDADVNENYIREHWDDVKFGEPEMDYRGTDIEDIEESEE